MAKGLWQVTSKLHWLCHAALAASWISPRLTWCFKGEDFMRCSQILAASCLRSQNFVHRSKLQGLLEKFSKSPCPPGPSAPCQKVHPSAPARNPDTGSAFWADVIATRPWALSASGPSMSQNFSHQSKLQGLLEKFSKSPCPPGPSAPCQKVHHRCTSEEFTHRVTIAEYTQPG